jgi:hypothetical protein
VDAAMKASVTELDMDTFDELLQADYLEDYVRFFFSQPRVRRILQWGFWEGLHYCPQCALFRTNWQAKPAGARYLDLVFKQWWTNATAATNSTGFASVRSFYGQHQITASYGGVSRTVPVTLSSAQQGATVTIQLNTAAASASPTRTPTPTRVPASASPTRTPTPTRAAASVSPTRTPTPTRAAASVSPTHTPSPTRQSTPTLTTTGPHSVSPSTATPGSTITVTTRVNVGSAAIVNGKVGYHLSPEGEYLDTNNIAKQWVDFSLGAFASQTFTFTPTIAPTARAGRYWLTVIVWDADWENIAWNTDLAILTVYPPEPTIDRVSLTTNPVARGGSTTITFHVNTATSAYTNAKVGFRYVLRPLRVVRCVLYCLAPSCSSHHARACNKQLCRAGGGTAEDRGGVLGGRPGGAHVVRVHVRRHHPERHAGGQLQRQHRPLELQLGGRGLVRELQPAQPHHHQRRHTRRSVVGCGLASSIMYDEANELTFLNKVCCFIG